ncbi:MAG: stage II sporulation protein M [Clostridiaceae bacterium]|nr:stage II sporulation protein M [Clostridiaceae bacterium]
MSELILRNHPSYVINYVNDLAHKKEVLPNLHTYELFMYLFLCNLLVCIVAVATGKIPFLFIPALLCINNGYNLGLGIAVAKIHKLNTLSFLLFGIIPHGMFEIPALIYAVSIGIYLSKMNTLAVVKNRPKQKHKPEIKKSFIFIIIPLLLIAALIESFITPILITFIK